jgi:hypothetical protein
MADPNTAIVQPPNPVAAAQQPAPNQAPITILLSPWDGDIDLTTKTGKSLWDEGIKPLETKFSGNGKDLARFLADITNRANKCNWRQILTFQGRSLLTHFGEIKLQEVQAAKAARDRIIPTTHAEARPKVNALMMFYFIYESLGATPQKKLSTKVASLDQDGPLLLKTVLDQTYVATQASTFAIKERFYELSLKKYKWNVQLLNQDVREKLADLVAAGNASDETDVLISLFRAYKTATNEEFLHSVDYWKNEWNSGAFNSAEELMDKAEKKFVELKDLGTWGKRSDKDDQIIALNAQVEALKRSDNTASSNNKNKQRSGDKKKAPRWKYDRSLSNGIELKKNGKLYKWCNGPGHSGTGMWVTHEPGKCTKTSATVANGTSNYEVSKAVLNRQALTSILQAKGNLSDDEIQSKVDAMIAVMES